MLEIDPAALATYIGLPLVGVLQDGLAAGGVERLDAQLEDLVLGLQAQHPLRLELGRQPVGVPAEAALDPASAHGLVARDEVLDVPGEQVTVVRQAVREGRAVVEDELVVAVVAGVARLDRGHEGAVLVPVRQDALLDLWELRARDDAIVPARSMPSGCVIRQEVDLGVGHRRISVISNVVMELSPRGRRPPSHRAGSAETARGRTAPRYHLACRTARSSRPALLEIRPLGSEGADGPTRPVLLGLTSHVVCRVLALPVLPEARR